MDRLPPTTPHSEFDHVGRQPSPDGLRPGYRAALSPRYVAEGRRDLTLHPAQCCGTHRHLAGSTKDLGGKWLDGGFGPLLGPRFSYKPKSSMKMRMERLVGFAGAGKPGA